MDIVKEFKAALTTLKMQEQETHGDFRKPDYTGTMHLLGENVEIAHFGDPKCERLIFVIGKQASSIRGTNLMKSLEEGSPYVVRGIERLFVQQKNEKPKKQVIQEIIEKQRNILKDFSVLQQDAIIDCVRRNPGYEARHQGMLACMALANVGPMLVFGPDEMEHTDGVVKSLQDLPSNDDFFAHQDLIETVREFREARGAWARKNIKDFDAKSHIVSHAAVEAAEDTVALGKFMSALNNAGCNSQPRKVTYVCDIILAVQERIEELKNAPPKQEEKKHEDAPINTAEAEHTATTETPADDTVVKIGGKRKQRKAAVAAGVEE